MCNFDDLLLSVPARLAARALAPASLSPINVVTPAPYVNFAPDAVVTTAPPRAHAVGAELRVPVAGMFHMFSNAVLRAALKNEVALILIDAQTRFPRELREFIGDVARAGATSPTGLLNLLSYTIDNYVSVETIAAGAAVVGDAVVVDASRAPTARATARGLILAAVGAALCDAAALYPPARALVERVYTTPVGDAPVTAFTSILVFFALANAAVIAIAAHSLVR